MIMHTQVDKLKGGNNIKRKVIIIFIFIFILLTIYILFKYILADKNNNLNIGTTDVVKITIINSNTEVKYKVIESTDEIDRILSTLNSIKLGDEIDNGFKGWKYNIIIENVDGSENNISISGGKISTENHAYSVDMNDINEFDDIYDSINSPENNINSLLNKIRY